MAFPGAAVVKDAQYSPSANDVNTVSITFVSGRLYILALMAHDSGGNTNTPIIAAGGGGGQSWTEMGGNTVNNDPEWEINAYWCIGNGGTSALTVRCTAADDMMWIVVEISQVDTTTPIRQSESGWNTGGAVSSLATTLPSAIGTNTATFGIFGKNDSSVITPGSGFTELDEVNDGGYALQCEWDSTPVDNIIDASESGTVDWASWVFEINPASVPQTVTPNFLASASAVHQPAVSLQLFPNFIPSVAQVFSPSIPLILLPDFIPSILQVYDPSVQGAVWSILPNFIPSTLQVPNPALTTGGVTVQPIFLASGAILYAVSIIGGEPHTLSMPPDATSMLFLPPQVGKGILS